MAPNYYKGTHLRRNRANEEGAADGAVEIVVAELTERNLIRILNGF